MSHLDELDGVEADLELRLKREYTAVFGLFRYCVRTQDASSSGTVATATRVSLICGSSLSAARSTL